MRTQRRPIWVAYLAALLLMAGSVVSGSGQSILTGKISGMITDDKGAPLPGVSLEIASPALVSGKRAAVSSQKGTYVFLNLPVGVYNITASLANFETTIREGIMISAGSSLVVDLPLQIGDINETRVVIGTAPILDAKTSTIDSKIESAMLDKLPTSRDAFYDLSLVTPGMFDHGDHGGSLPSPTAYGGASNENVFLINGLNATNPKGGSFGTLVRVNYNTVEEVRIVALGSKAEYGSYSGASIDVLTKSGGNQFHGSAAFYVSPVKWTRSNQPSLSSTFGTDWLHVDPTVNLYGGPRQKDWEGNLTIGGPIIKDKIWFYGGFDYIYNAGKRPRWDVLGENWGRYGDLKITAEPFTGHRAWASYHYESNDYTGGSWGDQPEWDTTMTYGVATKNNTASAQWQWLLNSSTILTAKYLGFWTNDTPHVPSDAPDHSGYVNWGTWAEYGVNGAFPWIEGWRSNRQTIQVDASHYAENFLGEHDIKVGAQFTKGRSNSLGGYFQNYINYLYPLRSTQYTQEMIDWYGDTGLQVYNYQKHVNPFLTIGESNSLGIFLDDQWSPVKRLTVNFGLRFDRMTAKYGRGFEYAPLTKPSDIGHPTVLSQRDGTDNIFDFKTLSPRIGLTYQLTKDAKTVARFSYGRYYLPFSVEYLRRYGPDAPLVTAVYRYFTIPFGTADPNGDGYIDSVEIREAARLVDGMTPDSVETSDPEDLMSWRLNVAPGVKDQYTDQLTLNLEREILKNFSVGVSWIYKNTANPFVLLPINSVTQQEWAYDRVPFTTRAGKVVQLYSIKWLDYDGNGVVDGQDVRWVRKHSDYKVVNLSSLDGQKVKRAYQGFQLTFNKRYSNRWQMLGSVLYSTSEGLANRIHGNSMNAEGPMFWDNTFAASLNYLINSLDAPLPFVPKFEFKLSGSYRVPVADVDLGARFRMHTGRPIFQLEDIPVRTEDGGAADSVIQAGGKKYIFGGNIDYLPIQTLLDLRAEKTFELPRFGSVSVILDVLNVFNANTPTAVDNLFEYGRINSIVEPRRFRFSFLFQF